MKQRLIHICDKNADIIGYERYRLSGADNSEDRRRMKKIIRLAMLGELTERQRFCVERYYIGGVKMKDIAAELGVSPSTVTRHIRSGEEKLRSIARYYG